MNADKANRVASVPFVVLWCQLHLCSSCFKPTVTTQVFLVAVTTQYCLCVSMLMEPGYRDF